MADRDDLARRIAAALDQVFGMRGDLGPAAQDYVVADALLADGWGKVAEAWDAGALHGYRSAPEKPITSIWDDNPYR